MFKTVMFFDFNIFRICFTYNFPINVVIMCVLLLNCNHTIHGFVLERLLKMTLSSFKSVITAPLYDIIYELSIVILWRKQSLLALVFRKPE
jgi:hypothetical protein